MYYGGISKDDIANGEGFRVVLWTSGCSHKCKGCHNPETWDEEYGKIFDERAEQEIYTELSKSYIDGITFSGGDPFYCNNIEKVGELIKKIKLFFPTKTIWVYTGYVLENLPLQATELLPYIDVLVIGKFKHNLKTYNQPWVGSSNQQVLYLRSQD